MIIPLLKRIDAPYSKNLVFTSAGDNANLHRWLKGHRNFDLWVSYYGEKTDSYKEHSDFYIARKGAKFPGLHYVYQHWPDILNHYHAILVMDDDIIISGSGISRLFEIRAKYDLWLVQPSFNPIGKNSHPITIKKPFTFMRYVNFIELGCPLFRKDKLDGFMKVYDPELVGWGVDWWFLDSLPSNMEGKVAIIDEISCINPFNWMKKGQREIDRLQDTPTRKRTWEKIKKKYNIRNQERGIQQFSAVKSPFSFSKILQALFIYAIQLFYKCGRILITLIMRSKAAGGIII